MRGSATVIGLLWLAGCGGAQPEQRRVTTVAQADTTHPWRKPGDKIDSILPMPEYLRRFREGTAETERLQGGAAGKEALAGQVLAGLAAQDTAALRRLLISRAEFAWLVFPEHVYSEPPYELDPAIFWLQLQTETEKGLARALQRYGGKPMTLAALTCTRDTIQIRAGPARLWSGCSVRYRTGDSVMTHRLFGSIVERDGRAKLLSFANEM